VTWEPQENSRTMRESSIASFEAIKASGLLSEERLRAYEAVLKYGPVTGSELNAILRSKSGHKRLSELQRIGLVSEAGKKVCRQTGRRCLAWIVSESTVIDGDVSRKVPRPSVADIKKALDSMRDYYRHERDKGTAPGDEFIRVMRWLVFLTK